MKIKLSIHSYRGANTPTKLCFALVLFIFCIAFARSQAKLTDSLIQEKIILEKQPGFTSTDTTYIKILYELGRSYIYQIPDSTKSISDKVMELSQFANFEKGLAGGELGLGLYYNIIGEFDTAFDHLENAEEKSRNSGASRLLLKTINAKAMGQFMKGNFPAAYLECKKGEKEATNIGNVEMQVFFIMNLATCFAILRDYKQALPYFQQALGLVKQTDDQLQKAQIESNLGYMYLHTNELEKAKEHCYRAIKVLNKEKFQAWESFAWATLGEVATKEKEYDKALQHFAKSDSLLVNIEDVQRKAETAQGIANVLYLKNDFDKSLEYALTADELSKKINYHQGIAKSSELLYKLLIEQNKTEEALKYLDKAKFLSDSILESENRTKFLMLETQAKFDRDKTLNEYENEKKLAAQKTITYVAAILLLSLILVVILNRNSAKNQKKANQSLEELNHTKDKLFSIIGHDLRTPIGTLQELLELYTSNEISEEEVAKLAPSLKENVDRSSFTLNNLLFWAKTQMNGINPEIKAVNVKEIARRICDTYTTRIEDKDLDIQCTIDPELTLMADPMQLEIILRNIISNAIKFSSKGGVIRFNSLESKNGFAEITIQDSGVGMKKTLIEAIKQHETIISTAGTLGEQGTGIGLQIVKDLVRINGGRVEIDSELNQGTSIFLYFEKAA